MKKRWSIYAVLAAAIISIVLMGGCIKRRDYQHTRALQGRSVEQVFDNHRDKLLSIPGVAGAGIARLDGKPSIVVMVLRRTPELDPLIPDELDGYSVIIEIIRESEQQGDTL